MKTAGPFLKYINCHNQQWHGSCLFLTHNDTTNKSSPTLILNSDRALTKSKVDATLLDTILGWTFWRFDLFIPLPEKHEHPIQYTISYYDGDDVHPTTNTDNTFWIPPVHQPFHFAYTSCNGISLDVPDDHYARKDPTYLWRDMLQVHSTFPFHALIGGGDQVYSDGVWKESEELVAWSKLSLSAKINMPWTDKMHQQSTHFYLKNYISSFTQKDVCTAYASIPTLFIWDDHDIWDGYGSYDDELQQCSVFKGLFLVAQRFYLLFQLHTTIEIFESKKKEFKTHHQQYYYSHAVDRHRPGDVAITGRKEEIHALPPASNPSLSTLMINPTTTPTTTITLPSSTKHNTDIDLEFLYNEDVDGFHFIRFLGETIAVFAIDMRTQRTKHAILPPHFYTLLRSIAFDLPGTIQHIIVLSSVPMIFPTIPLSEKILKFFKYLSKVACCHLIEEKTGLLDRFDQPEILDDITDGWAADVHRNERLEFIHLLQEIATKKHIRISIVAGDAHVAGVGRFYTHQHPKLDIRDDPLFMVEVISSAVMNSPPPFGIVNMLMRTNFASNADPNTRQKMVRAFWPTHPRTDKLLARRNWCDISVLVPPYCFTMNPHDPEFGGLRFCLRVENPDHRRGYAEEVYTVHVPRYPQREAVIVANSNALNVSD